jgi:uncharacterized protein YbjT (DUF2867 family)
MLIALQITGSSGLLGYRVLATALEAGYMVRAAVRKTAQIDAIKAAPSMQPHLKNVESLIIEDILAEGAYDEALKGVAYVLHVASPSAFPVSKCRMSRNTTITNTVRPRSPKKTLFNQQSKGLLAS